MVLARHIMEGEAIMLAPLGAKSGFPIYDGFTLVFNQMTASTAGAGPSDVEDFDDLRQA